MIEEAIRNKRFVSFDYEGHPRVVIPAAYGAHVNTGNPVLRGYQVDGTSSSRMVPLWDLYRKDKMFNIRVLDRCFDELPPMYSRGDKYIYPIIAEL